MGFQHVSGEWFEYDNSPDIHIKKCQGYEDTTCSQKYIFDAYDAAVVTRNEHSFYYGVYCKTCDAVLCTKCLPPGSRCDTNTDCGSGTCFYNMCGHFPVGFLCIENSNCRNALCGLVDGNAKSTTCCPNDRYINSYAGDDYCYGMPAGTPCRSNEMCNSNLCKGNWYGLTVGKYT
eukprot:gene12961-27351_t